MRRRKQIRSFAVAGLLALVLAGAAAGEPPAGDFGAFDSVARRVAAWWSLLWGDMAPSWIASASEVDGSPNLDPNGNDGAPNLDPNGQELGEPNALEEGLPPTEGSPDLDPNG